MLKHIIKSMLSCLILITACHSTTTCAADSPIIMVSIKPFYNICAKVMQSVGKPELLLHNNTSPHDYQLKPSDIKMLDQATLIIWGGPELETFLQKAIQNVPASKSMSLASIPGLKLLPTRTETNWETHEHDHDHDHDDHQHFANDAHFWLDPENAIIIASAIAQRLSEIDPTHAKIYHKNAAGFAKEIRQQEKIWKQKLAPMQDKAFIVFHDAYQYFDQYFNLNGVGSITLNPEIPPSVQRIQQIQSLLQQEQVSCIFSEPQFNDKIIITLSEGLPVYHGILDPLGQEEDLGPNGYLVLIDKLINDFTACNQLRKP